MTRPNHHRIQRQIFELAIGPEISGSALQASLADGFREQLLPALEEVFDSAAGPEHLLRFDRLEIDLGDITGADWVPELSRRLVSEMSRRLGEPQGDDAHANAPANAGAPEASDPFRKFLFFLEHGRLPWWAAGPLGAWHDCLPRNSAAREWGLLRSTLLAEPRARIRCVGVLGDESLDAALRAWCGLENSAQMLAVLTPPSLPDTIAREWRRQFWLMLIDWTLVPGADRVDGATLLQSVLELRRAQLQFMSGAGVAAAAAAFGAQRDLPELGERLPQPWREWHAELRQGPRSGRATHANVSRATAIATRPPGATGSSTARDAGFAADEGAIYLPAAGTILLHPFLETLFRERGLLAQRDFRDATARQRGVHLLGYLGFGTTDVPEHDLPLAKLLCGHPLDEPLDPPALDADDIAACDQLLTAVIGHWAALRSSSARWLRTQFFLREGKLECVDEGHRLTVERHAQDVLLARIPWGIGVIALPWMPCRLFVHWLD